jgi:hypothetical protein
MQELVLCNLAYIPTSSTIAIRSVQIIIIQLFIIYVRSQQLQGQLQIQHSVDIIIIIIIIQVNSIFYYLCAESTATRPITDTAQRKYNINNNNNNTIIIIIVVGKVKTP